MVAVAAHHIGYVTFNPFFKEIKGTVKAGFPYIPALHPFAFRKFPFIRSFIHDKESHFVAQVVEYRCLWVVAHADGVNADGFQVLQAAFPYFFRHYGSQYAGIMMQADTFYFHPFAVQGKSFVGVELQGPQSDTGFTFIYFRSVLIKSGL